MSLATLVLKQHVIVTCLDGAVLKASGTFTGTIVRAWNRDDNNSSSYINTGMSGCGIWLNTRSSVAAFDITGTRNTT